MGDNVILIGMPGCGKSTVGVVLAKLLGMDFVDVDLLIQRRQNRRLQQLLDELGMDAFLELESQEIRRLACAHTVIAPGGSAVLTEAGARHLRQLGRVVYLRVSPEELEHRLTNLPIRGVAMRPGQAVADLFAFRAPYYEKYADLTVDAHGSVEETALQIAAALEAN